jgi:hypothetical protein
MNDNELIIEVIDAASRGDIYKWAKLYLHID